MQRLLIVMLVLISKGTLRGQSELMGYWSGRIDKNLRVELKIEVDSTVTHASVHLPMLGITVDTELQEEIGGKEWLATFSLTGTQSIQLFLNQINKDSLNAEWHQNAVVEPIIMTRVDSFLPPARSQLPLKAYDYSEHEVSIYNSLEDFTLSGTLTLPATGKNFPVVVLISGSGLQNRNSEVFDHKPFLVLADHLTRNGVAVLRYDERGAGKSEGSYHDATSEDLKGDVLAVVRKMDSLGYEHIGLIGHSEGGMIAPMAAVEEERVDFIVSLAGPSLPIAELMIIQNGNILRDQGIDESEISDYLIFLRKAYALIDVESPKDSLYGPLKKLCYEFYESRDSSSQKNYGPSREAFYFHSAGSYLLPWLRYFINYEPGPIIERLSIPVLALNGKMDIQVTALENIWGYSQHLAKSNAPHYECIALDSINHLFQKVDDWNTYEYYESEETFNKGVMDRIVEWIAGLNL